MAGVSGAGLMLVGDMAVSSFYRWPIQEHVPVAALVTAAGFLGGALVYLWRARKAPKTRVRDLAKVASEGDRP
ncbi:MAG: hypothetical protein U1C74_06070 [Phenylobacterium sp.]|nr:hypothetical protein [Phenylobacterium sp.]